MRAGLIAICGILGCTDVNPAFDLAVESGVKGSSAGGSASSGDDPGATADPERDASASSTTGGGWSSTGGGAEAGASSEGSTGGGLSECEAQVLNEMTCHARRALSLPEACTPRPVAVADLDADGFDDVLVGCVDGALLMFPGSADGVGDARSLGPAGPDPRQIEVANLDGVDGLDVVVVNAVDSQGLRVFRHRPGQAYALEAWDPGRRPERIAIGDWFPAEGLDIAVTVPGDHQVVILDNDGSGGFGGAPLVLSAPSRPSDVGMAALDDEPGDELVVVSTQGDAVEVWFNDGEGARARSSEIGDFEGTGPKRVLLHDFELDGTIDAITSRTKMNGFRAYRNVGGGVFEGPPEIGDFGEDIWEIEAGDFDGNGLPDAVLSDHSDRHLIFLFLLEDGPFDTTVEHVWVHVEDRPWSIATGDVNGDGVHDVAVSLSHDDGLVVMLSDQ